MLRAEMVHTDFYRIFYDHDLVGCISSYPCSERLYAYFMDMQLVVKNKIVINKKAFCHMDMAEYERFLEKLWYFQNDSVMVQKILEEEEFHAR